ncbi:amidophosphoribosyltransferase [Prolixibacter denitrificans]|uniref:Amidophosphoribosyltransferase n=1 Tax=Prolixibacter denitrificans TaxID=1541063 RepID=A0A2P8CIF4_9BACT|nr:amidophosphoribosyltransferase [Prolixibacter denitrificans]PSK84758.1 amidophosphoribosyltransferase [Prolixibacter denitrificans]GET20923.1 amidophosphoribosyltransferase [Prolixibacter denitrificans]
MSELIKHECGIAMIRLRKPLEYYKVKYGTWQYGLNKLYLLMEKQHNRGQDGAGVVSVKIDMAAGQDYIHRHRSVDANPIKDVFDNVFGEFNHAKTNFPKTYHDPAWAKNNLPFVSELYLGHLRYGTFGRNSVEFTHPVMRQNNWRSRNLVLAGNFNLTNVDELFDLLVDLGQHPKAYTDTVTVLEKVGHFLDEENELLFRKYKNEGHSNKEISPLIERNLDLRQTLERSSRDWDGGYAIGGIIGHGDAFVLRDPWGIRPAYYYADDEIVVVASERPVIQTVMNVSWKSVQEVKPGSALIVKKDGTLSEEMVRVPQERKSCSFERIYFSRGSDRDIYLERKKLGHLLAPTIMDAVDGDLENTVFSYIPNTAETAFSGMMEGIRDLLLEWKKEKIHALGENMTEEAIAEIISVEPRIEKIAIKDVKMRTFITDDSSRDDLVGHVYDVTYGVVKNEKDTLVVIDDSIVRGTTLKRSILRILDRLHPKRIVIISSAPQIRYPDCYGIDMAELGKFIAFEAAITLLKETGRGHVIDETYKKCKEQQHLPKEEIVNYVKEIYRPFTDQEVSDKIAQLLKPVDCNAEVDIVYQTVDNLHKACPNDLGDWYFTGDYPTPGGNKVVNTSFINYIEGIKGRAY